LLLQRKLQASASSQRLVTCAGFLDEGASQFRRPLDRSLEDRFQLLPLVTGRY
jgi:hypothetical protein